MTSEEVPLAIMALAQAAASWRVTSFAWVLPPHAALSDKQAAALKLKGVGVEPFPAFVLELLGNYGEVYRGYSATRRNEIRRSCKEGVRAGLCQHRENSGQFFDLYAAAFRERAWYGRPYPLKLFHQVVEGRIRGAELLVAEFKGKVVAGGLLLAIGNGVHFLLSAVDRAAGQLYPMSQVMDCAIHRACMVGAVKFNLGGLPSSDAVGLIQFKESWGARRLEMVQLRYSAPLARLYTHVRAFLRFAPPVAKISN